MENKTRINLPTITADNIVEKAALTRVQELDALINNMVDSLSKASNGKNLTKYWKTEDELIKDVIRSFKDFNNVANQDNATELLKVVNALKVIHGNNLKDVIGDFDNLEKAIKNAGSIVGNLDSAFDVKSFKEAFDVFENLEQQGMNVQEVFGKLGQVSGIQKLITDLNNANNVISDLRAKASQLQDQLEESESGNGIRAVREECESLRFEILNIREEAAETFSAFLTSNNVDANSYRFEEYFERIREGSLTAKEAIAEFKRDYSYLLENNVNFDVSQLQDFSKRLDEVSTKITEVATKIDEISANGVKVSEGNISTGNIEELANVVEKIEEVGASTKGTSSIYESLSQILTTIKEIGQADTDNIYHLYATIRNLAQLNDLKVNKASLDNLADCIERICKIDNSSSLSNLSLVDLKKFNDLHISKASLNNLAEYLPQIAGINVDKLIELTKVDFSNLNNLQIDKNALNNLKQFANSISEVFRGNNSESNSEMNIAKAASEAADAKKEFAAANESVQSSVDGSKSPLQLEAELMDQVAKSAREAADTKKEFVEANKQVASSASSGTKDAFQGSDTAAVEKIAEDFQEVKQNTEKATESAKEYMKILSQVGEYGVDRKISTIYKRNDGQLESVNWRAKTDDEGNILYDKNGNIDYDENTTVISKYEQLEKIIVKADNELRNLQKDLAETKAYDPNASTTNIEEKIADQKAYIELLEHTVKVISQSDEYLMMEQQILEARNKAAREYTLTMGAKQEKADAKQTAKANEQAAKQQAKAQAQAAIEAENTKLEEQKSIYKELNDAIDRYATVSKRIASGNGLGFDEEEAARLQQRIEELQNEPILSQEQLSTSQSKLEKIEQTLIDIQAIRKENTVDSVQSTIDKYQKIYDQRKATPAEFNQSDTYKISLDNLNKANRALINYKATLAGVDTITEEQEQTIEKLTKDCEECANAFIKMGAAQKGSTSLSRDKLFNKIGEYMKKNSGMTKEFRKEFEKLQKQLMERGANANVSDLTDDFLKLQIRVREAGQEGKKFLDVIKEKAWYGMASQIGMYFGFNDIIRYIGETAKVVTNLNTKIIDLAKVSEATSNQIYKDFGSYADIAKEIGGTISDTIEATADWAKNGYNIPDAKELARVSQLYKNVGDNIDISSANESLISTLKGFQLEADQAEHIVDVFNEVSNNEAISSAGIGEALQQSAASFNAANTSLEKSVALITATNSVLQDTARTGNMWKTVSARIRGAKSELTEMGEDTDGMVESTSKLRDLIKGMTGFDIMEDENTFKDIYDIVIGIGEQWDKLSDVNQAALLEKLAGKNQSNALAAALNNVDILKKAYGEAMDAEGSAAREQEKYAQGVQYSIDRAKASLEELANDLLSSDFLKGVIDAGNKLINILDTLIDKFGVIPTLAAGIGAALSIKNVGEWNYISKSRSNNISLSIV